MNKKPQNSETYDSMYETGGWEGIYDLPYNRSPYFPLYKGVLRALKQTGAKNILEVGSGTGAFAEYALKELKISYRGLDFSPVAIERAKRRLNNDQLFYQADATKKDSYPNIYDAIVCTEVLEHIEDDLAVIKNWDPGVTCICSVPNYDSEYHVRHFRDVGEVQVRYGSLLDIKSIIKIRKPFLSDIGIDNRLRHIRWSLHKPKRLAQVMGFTDFDSIGGWFLLVGEKT